MGSTDHRTKPLYNERVERTRNKPSIFAIIAVAPLTPVVRLGLKMALKLDHRYTKTEYNSEQSHLLTLGIQFYISGRVTYSYCLIDSFLVVPLLFRHAIEYFLKSYLSFDHSMSKLKRKYGHNLPKLYNKFKIIEADKSLEKFDDFMNQFQDTEFMRYPKGRENLKCGEKDAPEIDLTLSFEDATNDLESNSINWSITTVDELVYIICKRMRSPISTIDWIEKRYRKNNALFEGNKFFKKAEDDGPLTIELSAPPVKQENE